MQRHRPILTILPIALFWGASAFADPPSLPTIADEVALSAPLIDEATYCSKADQADSIFAYENEHVCAARVLQDLVKNKQEQISLYYMASSYKASINRHRTTPVSVPLPLKVIGTMIFDNIETNQNSRRGVYPGPQPLDSQLRSEKPQHSADAKRLNWVVEGLTRAQAQGSCEAVTVNLFRRLSLSPSLSAEQRLDAKKMVHAMGIVALHPDDSCLPTDRPAPTVKVVGPSL